MAFIQTPVPNDIIPYEAGIAVFRTINPDGTKGTPIATNRDFVISAVTGSTRTVDTLSNGNGEDKEFPTGEKQTLALTVNSYNHNLHSVLAGRKHEITTALIGAERAIEMGILVADTSWGYAFTDTTVFPAKDALMLVTNTFNQPFEQVATAAAITEGQFHYDFDTKTITVAEAHSGQLLNVVFEYTDDKAISISRTEVITSPTFEITLIDVVQSAATAEKFNRVRILTRGATTGDMPEAPSQKDINTNMVYNFATTAVPKGMSPYVEKFSPYIEAV